ncbi:MAG: class I SAM-dependent methyltransferase [Nanoarchaeota archaeon]
MGKSIKKINKEYYDEIWTTSSPMSHSKWPAWQKIKNYQGSKMLEIGPGIRPRIPVKGSYFIELSSTAKNHLNRNSGKAFGPDEGLLNKGNFFDTICAFEVLEHVKDDSRLLDEINHSLKKGGTLILSVPLFDKYWSEWDTIVGHFRRYSPKKLENVLTKAGFRITEYAEDSFAKSYTGKISQKIAKKVFNTFPKQSLILESYLLRLMCWHARKFKPLKWKKGSIRNIPDSWAGVYVVCKKV